MPTSAQIAANNRAQMAQRGQPVYSYQLPRDQYTSTTAPPPSAGGKKERPSINRTYINVQQKQASGVKSVLFGNTRTILFAWVIALAVVCADEWKRFHVLPRPARLWWTTLVFAILAVVGQVDLLIPLANALAVGYAIVVAWQFFNKEGQFSE